MKPHNEHGGNNSGTNIAQGLVWAWRVLSPDAPFVGQGVSYEDDETQKVLVLLSDGRNQVVENDDITGSDYTSYGYLADGRMGSDRQLPDRRAERRREGVARLRERSRPRASASTRSCFQVDFAEDAGPLPQLRLDEREAASRSTTTSRTPRAARRRPSRTSART